MNWLYYLAEANIYLAVFYLAYCVFLSKETYYQLNRAYLLFSCVAAFALPVLQLGTLKPVEEAITATVNYTAPVTDLANYTNRSTPQIAIEPQLGLEDYLWYAYVAGAIVLLLVLTVKLFTLYKLISNKQRIANTDHKLIYLPGSDVAFSFFNYLFIGTNARGANTIIRHELVHITQKHSADILFLEVLKIISWFNPCIYLLQNSLKTVHEYIADERTAAHETDALTYSSFLVNNAYGAGGSSLTHSFFNYNLLKKRITMLNQQRSGNLARLKYLLPLPICAALLCTSTLAFSKTYGWVDLAPAKKNTVKPLDDRSLIFTTDNTVEKTGKNKRSANTAPSPQEPKAAKVVKFPPPLAEKNNTNLLVINGEPFNGTYKNVLPGKGGTIRFISANDADATKKWGPRAKKGVTVVTGTNVRIIDAQGKVKFAPPVLATDKSAEVKAPAMLKSDTVKQSIDKFYKLIINNIKYPTIDKTNNITGKVFTSFAFDEQGNVSYAKVLRTPSHSLGEEVLRVLKEVKNISGLKTGVSYKVPIHFSLKYDDDTTFEKTPTPLPKENREIYFSHLKPGVTPPNSDLILSELVVVGYAKK